jgi:hypothetical protein
MTESPRDIVEAELASLRSGLKFIDDELARLGELRREHARFHTVLLRILRALTPGLPPEPTEPAPALRLVTEFDLEPEEVTEERFAAMGDGSIVVPGAPGADKIDLDSVLDRLEAEGR